MIKLQAVKEGLHTLIIKGEKYVTDEMNVIEIKEEHLEEALSHGFEVFKEEVKEIKEKLTKKK